MIEKEYLANRIANANDVQLVALVYEGLIDTINSGIEYIAQGNKEKLNHVVHQVREILAELLATLQGDSEIAKNLRSIYLYVNKIVTEAEIKEDPGKLKEAIKVLHPLFEAWQELGEKDEVAASLEVTPSSRPSIVAGMTYGKGTLNDYVINNEDRWQKG